MRVRRNHSLLLLLLLAGCARQDKPVVGVVPKGANHIFWQTVRAGSIKAAREYGLEVEWNAPKQEIEVGRQIEIIDSMINRRLAGIVVAPIDRRALVNVIERAGKAAVPVAVFDSDVDSPARISYVSTDNREGGRMAARRLGEILGGKGKVAVIGFQPGSASTVEREEGFLTEAKKLYPELNVLPVQFGMADRAKAMAVTENVLTAHADLAGIFADNESSTAGAVQALKSRQAKHVKLVAFDASDQIVADMEAGWIDSLIVQDPLRMGYEAVKAIGMKRRGETPPARVDSGARLVLREELNRPEVRAYLFPDLKPYLGR